MFIIDSPRGGLPVYITGSASKTTRISPGDWGYLRFDGVRGIVSVVISNLTNPQPLDQIVNGSYICKIYSKSQYTQPNPSPPNFETDNNDVVAVWKDIFGSFSLLMRVPDGVSTVFVALKNTTTSDTLILTVSVEI